jgi:pyroglutamyl-peptidase
MYSYIPSPPLLPSLSPSLLKITPRKMVRYVLTGFGEFQDVPINPSQVIVRTIANSSLDKCAVRSSIVEVSMEGVCSALKDLQQCAAPTQPLTFSPDPQGPVPISPPLPTSLPLPTSPLPSSPDEQEIWVHLGVNSKQEGFRLEKIAWNEATFRVPDQRGAQPHNQKIYTTPEAPPSLQSTLQLDALAAALTQRGFPTETSEDPGRFLCNYIYYHTLDYCAKNNTHGVFVHIPPFSQIPLDTQLKFVRSLLEILPTFCPPSCTPLSPSLPTPSTQ